MQRRREVLQYLDRSHTGIQTRAKESCPDSNKVISESGSRLVGLRDFLAIRRGTPPDPAKRVGEVISATHTYCLTHQ